MKHFGQDDPNADVSESESSSDDSESEKSSLSRSSRAEGDIEMEEEEEQTAPMSEAMVEMVIDREEEEPVPTTPVPQKKRARDGEESHQTPLIPEVTEPTAKTVPPAKKVKLADPVTPPPAENPAVPGKTKGKAKAVSFGPVFAPEPSPEPSPPRAPGSFAPAFSPIAAPAFVPEWVTAVSPSPRLEFCDPRDMISFKNCPLPGSEAWNVMEQKVWTSEHWCYASVSYFPPVDTKKELLVAGIAAALREERQPPNLPTGIVSIEYPLNSDQAPWGVVCCSDKETLTKLLNQEKVYNSAVPTLVTFRAQASTKPPAIRWIKLEAKVPEGADRRGLSRIALATANLYFPDAAAQGKGTPIRVPNAPGTSNWAAAAPEYPREIAQRTEADRPAGHKVQWLFAIRQEAGSALPPIQELVTPPGMAANQPRTIKSTAAPQCAICRSNSHWSAGCWWKAPLGIKGIPWRSNFFADQWRPEDRPQSSEPGRSTRGARGGGRARTRSRSRARNRGGAEVAGEGTLADASAPEAEEA